MGLILLYDLFCSCCITNVHYILRNLYICIFSLMHLFYDKNNYFHILALYLPDITIHLFLLVCKSRTIIRHIAACFFQICQHFISFFSASNNCSPLLYPASANTLPGRLPASSLIFSIIGIRLCRSFSSFITSDAIIT